MQTGTKTESALHLKNAAPLSINRVHCFGTIIWVLYSHMIKTEAVT